MQPDGSLSAGDSAQNYSLYCSVKQLLIGSEMHISTILYLPKYFGLAARGCTPQWTRKGRTASLTT